MSRAKDRAYAQIGEAYARGRAAATADAVTTLDLLERADTVIAHSDDADEHADLLRELRVHIAALKDGAR